MSASLPLPMPYGDEFGEVLRRYRLRAGLAQNSLAKLIGLTASYVNRLESGYSCAPGREVVLALARGMASTADDTDRLMASAGYLPPSQQKLGIDSTVQAVVRLLTDDRYSPESRADFRACVEAMAARWAAPATVPGPAARRLRGQIAAAWERNGGGDEG